MPVLVVDTATGSALAAVGAGPRVLAERLEANAREAAGRILIAVDAVLDEAGLGRRDLEGVVVGVGPGSFTGLRIGIATALGLAHGLGIPATPVSSLAALADGAPGATVAVDARRGELFVLAPGGEAQAIAAADVARELDAALPVVGEGALRYRAVLEAGGFEVPGADDARHRLRAASYLGLARFDGRPVAPVYLRPPDAVPSRPALQAEPVR